MSARNLLEIVLGDWSGQDEPVVLVGAEGLLAAPFAAHHDEATGLPDRCRRDQREQLGVQVAVEIGDDLADDVDLHPLTAKRPDLRVDLARRLREFRDGRGAVDAPRDQLRIAGEKAQEVDVLEDADELAVRCDRHPPLVVLGHLEKRGRDEIVLRDADDRPVRERADRAFDRPTVHDRRVQEVGAGQDADPLAVRTNRA